MSPRPHGSLWRSGKSNSRGPSTGTITASAYVIPPSQGPTAGASTSARRAAAPSLSGTGRERHGRSPRDGARRRGEHHKHFLASLKEDLMGVRMLLGPDHARCRAARSSGLRRVRRETSSRARACHAAAPAGAPSTAVGDIDCQPGAGEPQPDGLRRPRTARPRAHGIAHNPFTPCGRRSERTTGATARRARRRARPHRVQDLRLTSAGSGSPSDARPAARRPRRQGNDPAKTKIAVHYNVAAQFGVIPPALQGAAPASPTASTPATEDLLRHSAG